jgi:hypothetical protein
MEPEVHSRLREKEVGNCGSLKLVPDCLLIQTPATLLSAFASLFSGMMVALL